MMKMSKIPLSKKMTKSGASQAKSAPALCSIASKGDRRQRDWVSTLNVTPDG
jgi:hypothetical protein